LHQFTFRAFDRNSQSHLARREGPISMEPRRPFDPLSPAPIEPLPSPLRPPSQHIQRSDESVRILKEILDRLTGIENRLKVIEEHLKTKK
jgi:hypothetical protein